MAEERLQRRLAAILSADVVGYSRLMGIDEAGTLARLKALRRDLDRSADCRAFGPDRQADGRRRAGGVRAALSTRLSALSKSRNTFVSATPAGQEPIRSNSALASMSATSLSKTAISWVMASISPPGSKASPSLEASRFPRTHGDKFKARSQPTSSMPASRA